jgi:hypothetical protein
MFRKQRSVWWSSYSYTYIRLYLLATSFDGLLIEFEMLIFILFLLLFCIIVTLLVLVILPVLPAVFYIKRPLSHHLYHTPHHTTHQ